MRSTAILASVFFAATALALPLDSKRTPAIQLNQPNHKLTFPTASLIDTALASVTNIVDDVTGGLPETLPDVLPIKRQIELPGVSDLAGNVVGTATGTIINLLPTVVSTLHTAGGEVDTLRQDVKTASFDSTLSGVESTLTSIIDEIEAVTGADGVNGVDLSSELASVETELSAAVTEAEDLLASVQSLTGLVGATDTLSEVESLAGELADLLAGLL